MYPFLTLASFALALYCVVSIVMSDPARVRGLPRLAWLAVVLLLPLIGSLAWLLVGRPAAEPGARPVGSPSSGGGPQSGVQRGRRPSLGAGPSAPRGPEDDPAFLRDVEERLRRQRDHREEGDA